jgi:hypothetical protein
VLLTKDILRRTAWYVAVEYGNLVSAKLLDLAEEALTKKELNDNIFLTKYNCKSTAWHIAAEQLNILHKLWE